MIANQQTKEFEVIKTVLCPEVEKAGATTTIRVPCTNLLFQTSLCHELPGSRGEIFTLKIGPSD